MLRRRDQVALEFQLHGAAAERAFGRRFFAYAELRRRFIRGIVVLLGLFQLTGQIRQGDPEVRFFAFDAPVHGGGGRDGIDGALVDAQLRALFQWHPVEQFQRGVHAGIGCCEPGRESGVFGRGLAGFGLFLQRLHLSVQAGQLVAYARVEPYRFKCAEFRELMIG